MNLSRLAVLAVFFMMVMSAFVAVPAYNASANHENHNHEHDHEHDQDHNEVNEDHGDHRDHDNDDWRLESIDVVFEMEDLGNWLVKIKGNYPVEESDRFREDLAQMCEDMMGGNPGEITKECYEHSLTMENNDDHGDHDGCPPGLTDEACEQWEECGIGSSDSMNMSCMRIMYDYCETSSHCSNDHEEVPEDCYDDDGEPCGPNFFYAVFAYQDGKISAEEFMTSQATKDFIADMNDDDDNHDDDNHDGDNHDNDECDYYYGDNEDRCSDYANPGLYQTDVFTVDVDQEVIIHPNFENSYNDISPPFICGDGTEISFGLVNDNNTDCEDGADEQWYDSNTPDDNSDDCQKSNDEDCVGEPVNWFDCADDNEVWIYQVNDGNWDCSDGEDEVKSDFNYWYGTIYLLEGEHNHVPGMDLSLDEVFAHQTRFCDWNDENKTYVDCSPVIVADLEADMPYTLFTMTSCYHFAWQLECANSGIYNHTMELADGSLTNIIGEVYSSPKGYCGGCWESDGEGNFVQASAANFTATWNTGLGMYSENTGPYSNFLLYDVHNVVVTEEDNFDGAKIMVLGRTCYDHYDDEEEYCYPSIPSVYLYDAFDPENTEQGLLASIKGKHTYTDEDDGCPPSFSNCTSILTDLELETGDYTVVTAFDDSPSTLMNIIMVRNQNDDGFDIHDSWSATYRNSWFSYEDGERVYYSGDDRLHFPAATPEDHYDHDDYTHERPCPSEMSDDECDSMYEFHDLHNSIMENITAYENNEISAVDMAMVLTNFIVAMDERGMFSHGNDGHDEHMSLDSFDISSWDSINDLQSIVDWFNNEYHYDENESEMTVDEFLSMCENISEDEDVNEEVAQCVLDKALSMMSDHDDHDHHDDHGDHVNHGPMVCYDNVNHDVEFQFDNEDDCVNAGFMWVPANSGPGNQDDNNSDDTPATLDGIIGIEDPENAGDNCTLSANDPHLIGNVEDNKGKQLTCTFEFKIRFEGVDKSLDTHVAHIPFEAQDVWTLKMMNTLGYEVTSCDNCMMDADGLMNGTGPVNITFGKVEPKPDCDYTIALSADGMAFDPVKLAINVGETVCWQWKDAAMAHNVVELEAEYDASMNLTGVDFGFSSGEPAMTVDFRHTFTEDNKVHYYVCEPHAQLGMVGQITVGNGTDDPVQQVIEDNEVPSIGFIVGSLVLVGAASLRRRIH